MSLTMAPCLLLDTVFIGNATKWYAKSLLTKEWLWKMGVKRNTCSCGDAKTIIMPTSSKSRWTHALLSSVHTGFVLY